MMRRSLLLVAALAAPAVISACHKDAGTPRQTTPSNKAETPSVSTTADDALGFLPADADIIGGVDGVALRASALYKQFEPMIASGLGEDYARFRDACGFDPLTQIERVTFAGKMMAGEKFQGVAVMRGVSGTRTLDCIGKELQAKAAVTNEGGVLTVADRDNGGKMVATIVGNTTMVAAFIPAGSTLTLEAVLGSGTPLRGSTAFMALYERREAGAAVWGMVNGNSPLLAQMEQAGAKPTSLDGTLVLRDKFDATMRATFTTPDMATNMQKQVAPVQQMMGGQVEKLDVTTSGPMLVMHVVVTAEQLKNLAGMLGAFM